MVLSRKCTLGKAISKIMGLESEKKVKYKQVARSK